jgi:hypothetical protein
MIIAASVPPRVAGALRRYGNRAARCFRGGRGDAATVGRLAQGESAGGPIVRLVLAGRRKTLKNESN